MLLRSIGSLVLLFLIPAQYPADTRQSLRDRYGAPISENFLVRPGVVATASYAPSGDICEIVVRPERLWNSTLGSVNVRDIVDEVVPPSERGKREPPVFVDVVCFPTMDCGGVEDNWEKVNIFYNGGTGKERYAQIHWRRDECRPEKNK